LAWCKTKTRLASSRQKIPLLAILETMRSLGLFSERPLGHYLAIILRNRLAVILAPADAVVRKPRAAVKRGRSWRPADQPARTAAYELCQSLELRNRRDAYVRLR